MSEDRKFVREPVRVDDPDLSDEANRVLTAELREALGRDEVELPAEAAAKSHELPPGERGTLGALLGKNRLLIAVAFIPLLIIGVIVSLSTGSWWAVVAATAVHAAGTVIVGSIVLRLSTAVEHVDPSNAAVLEEEGIGDPDQALSDLVDRYQPGEQAKGAAEVVSGGHNRVTTRPDEDRSRATAEQRTAQTPAANPTEPAGSSGMPMMLPILAVGASLLVGIVVAATQGGIAWIGALLLLGAAVGWLLLERQIGRGGAGPDREPGDTAAGRRARLLPTLVLVVLAVVAGVIIVGAVGGFLG